MKVKEISSHSRAEVQIPYTEGFGTKAFDNFFFYILKIVLQSVNL